MARWIGGWMDGWMEVTKLWLRNDCYLRVKLLRKRDTGRHGHKRQKGQKAAGVFPKRGISSRLWESEEQPERDELDWREGGRLSQMERKGRMQRKEQNRVKGGGRRER